MARATEARLALPHRFTVPDIWMLADQFAEKRVEFLLNLAVRPDGSLAPLDIGDLRIGQGPEWRHTWGWLSAEIDAGLAREAVRLAARIMRSDAVTDGLSRAVRSTVPAERMVAIAVVRRWSLTLQVMTWLEDALAADWADVRAADLACLAFASVKPEWPRRLMAVSHRSTEVKPVLRRMRLWKSGRCALDANYLPSWETNTGMIWSLFAATPALARVSSPTYADSPWCRRESELIDYLLNTADYLPGRLVIDTGLDALRALDDLADRWNPADEFGGTMPEFPPILTVWRPRPIPRNHLAVLRAGGALRAMSAFLRDPDLVNRLVPILVEQGTLPCTPPTNDPEGWASYARIFRDLASLAPQAALSLPPGYGPEQVERDVELCGGIPDLTAGTPALDDILVAMEFFRSVWPPLLDERYGRFLVVDLRGHTGESFAAAAERSLDRGMLAFRVPVPLWLLQNADQDASSWGLPGDPPILTEHVDSQFAWMVEAWPGQAETMARYPADSGLIASPALRQVLGAP
ncbi:hypothetical protein [Paractinoplanes durhamensis]|uniref:Uncharacterized protein n=1 Tax=Paractinoplanes durhamensis TaxID=113563 RepID=A0ABQ3Z8P0_9ACTN|nr:hypothetical protein [Actinoplanes durhamensis]GIE06180.1 hypothetical protein Adu01nite_75300 [Actinoplanes durhamensis]